MKTWILAFSVALLGTGATLGLALRPRLAAAPEKHDLEGGWKGAIPEYPVSRFVDELGLSKEQGGELTEILGETQRDIESFNRAVRESQERARERLLGLLNDEQKRKFGELAAAERMRRAKAEVDKEVSLYTKLLDLTPDQARKFGEAVRQTRSCGPGSPFKWPPPGGFDWNRRFHGRPPPPPPPPYDPERSFQKILTPEQYRSFKDFQKNGRH